MELDNVTLRKGLTLILLSTKTHDIGTSHICLPKPYLIAGEIVNSAANSRAQIVTRTFNDHNHECYRCELITTNISTFSAFGSNPFVILQQKQCKDL